MAKGNSLIGGAALGVLVAGAAVVGLSTSDTAHAASCRGADSVSAGVKTREAAFRCLLNAERGKRGLPKLVWRSTLTKGARRSNNLMVRCADFSHTPCGERPATTTRKAGYRASFQGENIAWGSGRLGSARATFRGWMDSQGHRRNMLHPNARAAGVAVSGRRGFQGYQGVSIWTLQLGRR